MQFKLSIQILPFALSLLKVQFHFDVKQILAIEISNIFFKKPFRLSRTYFYFVFTNGRTICWFWKGSRRPMPPFIEIQYHRLCSKPRKFPEGLFTQNIYREALPNDDFSSNKLGTVVPRLEVTLHETHVAIVLQKRNSSTLILIILFIFFYLSEPSLEQISKDRVFKLGCKL